MAFKKVGGAKKFFKYAECQAGQVLVENGLYMGTEEGTYGPYHVFREKEGQLHCLNSAGQLDYLIKSFAKAGESACKVIYSGMEEVTKGPMKGEKAHTFEFYVDEGDEESPSDDDEISLT